MSSSDHGGDGDDGVPMRGALNIRKIREELSHCADFLVAQIKDHEENDDVFDYLERLGRPTRALIVRFLAHCLHSAAQRTPLVGTDELLACAQRNITELYDPRVRKHALHVAEILDEFVFSLDGELKKRLH